MANEKVLKGPYWTRNWIEAMWRFTNENFVDFDTGAVDYEALGKEEFQFRKALFFRNFKNSERAKMAFASAKDDYKNSVENGKKGGRPKKSPQDAPNGNAGVDMSDAGNGAASKSPTSCDTFTADGDTREDSLNVTDGSNAALLESGASANLYGDAPRREAGEAFTSRESGAFAPTTVSRNMRRVPQNEAPAHGFSGGRTAQGTMSRSPEAAAQSGKDYDQEASISADDPQPEGLTGPSHGGSVASLEARQSQALESRRRAGADSVRGTPSHRAPARQPVRSGRKFRNKEEFIQWAIDTGLDPNDAGDCWEATMERGGLTKDGKKVDNLCAYTVKWCRTSKKNRETA